jgi:hypothetical protein
MPVFLTMDNDTQVERLKNIEKVERNLKLN